MPSERTPTSGQERPKTSKFKPHRPVRPLEPTVAPAESTDSPINPSDATPTIPPDLLTKLLHEFFEDDRTRISADANALVAKYIETFVKEALARATLERSESSGSSDKFLEVSSSARLERMAVFRASPPLPGIIRLSWS